MKVKPMTIILIGGIIAAIGAIIIALGTYLKTKQESDAKELKEKIELKYGEIEDTSKISYPILEIGNSGSRFVCPNGVFLTVIGSSFKFYVRNNKLFVTTLLRDTKGNIIASVNDNVWEIIKDGYDYNYDDFAIEIITLGDRKILFQLELKDGIVHFTGLVTGEDGEGVYMWKDPNLNMDGAQFTFMNKKVGMDIPNYTHYIFKYPRAKYFRTRVKD